MSEKVDRLGLENEVYLRGFGDTAPLSIQICPLPAK